MGAGVGVGMLLASQMAGVMTWQMCSVQCPLIHMLRWGTHVLARSKPKPRHGLSTHPFATTCPHKLTLF